jgi:hypothetical protein
MRIIDYGLDPNMTIAGLKTLLKMLWADIRDQDHPMSKKENSKQILDRGDTSEKLLRHLDSIIAEREYSLLVSHRFLSSPWFLVPGYR